MASEANTLLVDDTARMVSNTVNFLLVASDIELSPATSERAS